MFRSIALALVVLGSLFITPAPAEAAATIVIVQGHVGGQNGNLRYATKFVDKYTKTRFIYGTCNYKHRCITVKIDRSLKRGTGWSSWRGSARKNVTIGVNPGRGDGYMRRLFAHEVGHAMFLSHSRYRTNLMYPTLHKANGKMVTFRFTDAQRATLGKH